MTALEPTPRLKSKRTLLPGGELEVVGPMGLVKVTRLPLITVGASWYEDLRIVAPNGRRRQPITCSGHRRKVLHEYGRLADIPKRVHPHGFRHTLAVDLVREGFSINNVQAQLGHSNVATTATYLRGMGADEAFDRVAARPAPGGRL